MPGLGILWIFNTCMEVLQGLSIPEITSMEGQMWRSAYEDPTNDTVTGLGSKIWPKAFDRMERFTEDVNILPGDVELDYDPVINLFTEGKAAIIRAGGETSLNSRITGWTA